MHGENKVCLFFECRIDGLAEGEFFVKISNTIEICNRM